MRLTGSEPLQRTAKKRARIRMLIEDRLHSSDPILYVTDEFRESAIARAGVPASPNPK
jgi:hypothetical protein